MTDTPTLEQVAELLRDPELLSRVKSEVLEDELEQAALAVEQAALEQGAAEVLAEQLESFGCPLTAGGPAACTWCDDDECVPEKDKPLSVACWLAYARAESRKRQEGTGQQSLSP